MQLAKPPVIPQSTAGISFKPVNSWAVEEGREYVVIDRMEQLEPFFLNIVGAGNHWLFCSSNGALSAGRQSPETALFPYYTVDKIIDNWNTTGPWTAVVSEGGLWNPFRPSIALLSPVRRKLMKSVLGDEVVFDETHEKLGLRMTYRWQLSNKYGFVRRAKLENVGGETREMRMADGLDNLLPPGVESRMQLEYSCLADAYKVSELDCDGTLMVHRLAAGITDQPIPLENMRATTVWVRGLGEGPTYMDRRDVEKFLRGQAPRPSQCVRAKRGALFLARELSLAPGESVEWMMVAELEQTQKDVGELRRSLADPAALEAAVLADIESGRERLRELVASADGFQQTADRDTALYHYQNALCNILRGGVPAMGMDFDREHFVRYLRVHNRQLFRSQSAWLGELPENFTREELIVRAEAQGDPDLIRLSEEYLPLVLSRRHGDPSRPWNRFVIRMQDESGGVLHHFEGNWRDIFQNWEGLAWSYPGFIGTFISKFLNASTVDGYNPYRITSEGVDWEVPDEDDPWASIGYWGDHQIVYLLKFLELEARVHPGLLAERLDSLAYVFVDVPYRLRSWKKTLQDPRDTVEFDRERHENLMELKSRIGADGLLLRSRDGEVVRVTLAEKLLLPAAVKLANLVPGGGIWMNTQRPEWNDANNALAGCGLSVVTAGYLYRYLGFLEGLVGRHLGDSLRISPALTALLEALGDLFGDESWGHAAEISDTDRFALVQVAGKAVERYRRRVYDDGPGQPEPVDRELVLSFLKKARSAVEGTLRQNRREDGLWHSYNVLNIGRREQTMGIDRLSVMLEGQVSILSAGILEPAEALSLLETLAGSDLRSARHPTYLLYPDAEVSSFLETNRMEVGKVMAIGTLAAMAERGDERLLVADPECGFRFQSNLTNDYALAATLEKLAAETAYAETLAGDRLEIEALYESVFNHRSFTGRSGSMFGYEGLGSVYWHMVSKLMLAVQEVTLNAVESGADEEIVQRLAASYFSIQSGLGFRQSPESYGAFSAEPYSHSPSHAGAQQPGLTGQVKEGILCRLGELGVEFQQGRLMFRPRLLRNAEFEGLSAGPEHSELAPGTIAFTLARTPVVYHRCGKCSTASATLHFSDGSKQEAPDAVLDEELTNELIQHSGRIVRIEVEIPSSWLIC